LGQHVVSVASVAAIAAAHVATEKQDRFIAGIVKTSWFKGKFGEFLVNFSARCLLDKSRYHSRYTMDRHNYSQAGKQ
jgi:hypothetical protein